MWSTQPSCSNSATCCSQPPTTHATVLLMPSQAFMKMVLKENLDISNADLVQHMPTAAKIYAKYFVNCNLQNPCPDGTDWTLDAALLCYKSFYVEALPQKWSNIHLFKCNCSDCLKCASCVHILWLEWCVIHRSRYRASEYHYTTSAWAR